MAQIFAYIAHKGGVAEDSAAELALAATKIDAGASVTAIVAGSGGDLDAVCNEVAASYKEVWKIDGDAFAYPNAEVIRKLLVNILPADAIVLVAHDTFGMDLSPGLSIKLDAAFVSDVVDIEGVEGSVMNIVRQEYGGQVSTHVTCDFSAGAVFNIRPGVFQVEGEGAAAGSVVDKSGEAGDVTAGRRYLETVAAKQGMWISPRRMYWSPSAAASKMRIISRSPRN